MKDLVAGGSMVGSGGFIVMDETVDIFESTKNLTEFYKHESCGWCTPCREGTDWLVKIFKRIDAGGGRPEDAQLMLDICDNIEGKSFCRRSATLRRGRCSRRSRDFPKILRSIWYLPREHVGREDLIMTEEEYMRMKKILNTIIE